MLTVSGDRGSISSGLLWQLPQCSCQMTHSHFWAMCASMRMCALVFVYVCVSHDIVWLFFFHRLHVPPLTISYKAVVLSSTTQGRFHGNFSPGGLSAWCTVDQSRAGWVKSGLQHYCRLPFQQQVHHLRGIQAYIPFIYSPTEQVKSHICYMSQYHI